jgi:DNA/RNA-binding domain of Phe-tRNA-synthetase-like protein
MSNINILKDPSIEDVVKLGIIIFSDLNCQEKNEVLWISIEKLGNQYRDNFTTTSEALELLQPARKLYRSIGIEPTRTRPSSEALLRRVIKNKGLYQVNSIVDVSNLCSLKFLLPIGLYDMNKIFGTVEFRLGDDGEEYVGIRKEIVHVGNRFTVADNKGAFGNPSSDSLRTSIDLSTNNILMVIFAPKDYSIKKLEANMSFSSNQMLEYHLDGKIVLQKVL